MTPGVAATLAVILTAAGYALACWWWPFRACGRCDGSGKKRSPGKKAWRTCGRCRGSGAKLRYGRRVLNYARKLHSGQ